MGIIDNAKNIAELIKKYNDHELYEKIVSLREEILLIREENIELKEKLKSIEKSIELNDELIKDGNRYFKISDSEKKQPYCLTCWDVDRKLVSLIVQGSSLGTTILCNICKKR